MNADDVPERARSATLEPAVEDDASLLFAWRAGDTAAGRRLVDRHFAGVYRFFVNKLGADVDDLVQQTFLAVVAGRDRVRDEAGFRSYVFGIARNRLMRHFRDRRPTDAEQSIGELQAATMSLAEGMAKKREHKVLLAALRRLPIDLQIAVELAYFEGLTDREVAEVLEVPVGTLKSRLRKARGLLAETIAELTASKVDGEATLAGLDAWVASIREIYDDAASRLEASR